MAKPYQTAVPFHFSYDDALRQAAPTVCFLKWEKILRWEGKR